MQNSKLRFGIVLLVCIAVLFTCTLMLGAANGDSSNQGTIVLFVGSNNALKGEELIKIDENAGVSPVIQNSTTLVPLRFVAETLGAEVSWNSNENTATVKLNNKSILIDFNSKTAAVLENGNKESKTSKIECGISQGRALVPIRFISENFGKEVFYDRGLIVISDTKDIYDSVKDKELLDGFINKLNSLPIVGNSEKFKELVGTNNLYKYDNFILNESATDATTDSTDAAEFQDNKIMQEATAAAPEAQSSDSAKKESATGEAEYSDTNVQVQGVDEPDIIKTDGKFIYYAKDNVVYVVSVNNDGSLNLLNKINSNSTNSEYYLNDIFIYNDKLILIGNKYENELLKISSRRYSDVFTTVQVFDLKDKTKATVEKEFGVNGEYLQARKIDSYVYLVASNYVYSEAVPLVKDSADGSTYKDIGYDTMHYIPDCPISQMTTVVGIDLNKPNEKSSVFSFLGNSRSFYASGDNLYLAAEYDNYSVMPMPMSSDIKKIKADINSNKTDIYKFSLNKGKVTYLAKGSVEGRILNQFSMDESKGYFRVATTTESYSSGNYKQYNNIIVMDEVLNKVGEITDIAPDEKIYSARFMGDKAYIVTFKTVDPLFVIDLSSPTNPKILGALKIPGYSDYLHPYDENHIIGFGKDTVEYDGGAYYKGMKIAIFDVSDVTKPKEMFTEMIGDRGTESELLRNHKALLFSKEKNLLAFPITVCEIEGKDKKSGDAFNDIIAYGQFKFQGAYVYNIDLKTGFKLKGKISHLSDEDYLKSSMYEGNSDNYIDRIIFIKNNLYTFSKNMIKSNDINTISEKGILKLNN